MSQKLKVLGFGEVLWDKINGKLIIGGTIFNLIAHCKKMGSDSYLISSIGNDKLGIKTKSVIKEKGIKTDFINIVDKSTCVVKVDTDNNYEPSYRLSDSTSWDFIDINESDIELINKIQFDYFCFGTLGQRSLKNTKSLKNIFDNCNFDNIFCDINLRLNYYDKSRIEYSLERCNILKMNWEEAGILKNMLGLKNNEYGNFLKKLSSEFNIDIICITKGGSGADIYSKNDLIHCPGYKVKVKDTVGSGDAFSAALITKIYNKSSLKDACEYACKIGAVIASKRGAVPSYNSNDINILS